jgi:hypothetical protein
MQHRFYWNGMRDNAVCTTVVPHELEELCNHLVNGAGYEMSSRWVSCYFIKSYKNCPPQELHVDNDELQRTAEHPRLHFKDLSFSILVALEKDRDSHLIGTGRGEATGDITLGQGDAVVFRGDWLHAGAGNSEKMNIRLFIAVGSELYPNNDYVGVVLTKKQGSETGSSNDDVDCSAEL